MDSICPSCKAEESMVPANDVACPRAADGRCYGNGRMDSAWYRSCCRTCSWVLNTCQMCGGPVTSYSPNGNWRRYWVTFRVAEPEWSYRHAEVAARNPEEALRKAAALAAADPSVRSSQPAEVWVIVELVAIGSGGMLYTPVVHLSPNNPFGD